MVRAYRSNSGASSGLANRALTTAASTPDAAEQFGGLHAFDNGGAKTHKRDVGAVAEDFARPDNHRMHGQVGRCAGAGAAREPYGERAIVLHAR